MTTLAELPALLQGPRAGTSGMDPLRMWRTPLTG